MDPCTSNSPRGLREGQRKDGRGSSDSWQPTGRGLTEATRLAKTARMADEGTGARDMAERFLKKRVEVGGGVVGGLSLAIQAPSTDERKCWAVVN